MPFRLLQPAQGSAVGGQPVGYDENGVPKSDITIYSPDNPYAQAAQQSTNPFGAAGDFVNNLGGGIANFVGGVVNPLINTGAMASSALIAGAKSLMDPQHAGADLVAPINIPQIGTGGQVRNANPFKADEYGGLDVNKSLKDAGGTLAEAGGTAAMLGLAPETLGLAGTAAAGAAIGAGHEVQKDNATLGSTLAAGALGGGTGAAAYGAGKLIGGLLTPKTAEEAAAAASEAGSSVAQEAPKVPEATATPNDGGLDKELKGQLLQKRFSSKDANTIATLTPELKSTFSDYLDAGVAKDANQAGSKRVTDIAGQEINDFYDNVQKAKQDIGAQVGEAKDGLRTKTIDTTPIQEKFQDLMKKLNIKQIDGAGNLYEPGEAIPASSSLSVEPTKLHFGKSDIKTGGAALDAIQSIWNDVQNNPTMNARDAEALTSQIDGITGQLKDAGVKMTMPNRVLGNLKTAINQSVEAVDPEFAAVNQKFAKIAQYAKPIKNAIVTTTKDGSEFINGGKMLDTVMKTNPTNFDAALEGMQNIEKEFGIKAPTDLRTKAVLADIAEKITDGGQRRSMGGIINTLRTGFRGANRIARVGENINAMVNPLSLDKIPKAVADLQSLLENSGAVEEPINNAVASQVPTKPKVPLSPEQIQTIKDTIAHLKQLGSTGASAIKDTAPMSPDQISGINSGISGLRQAGTAAAVYGGRQN